MGKKRIISIDVSTGSYPSFIERITALARVRVSSYVCVANVHMVVEAYADSRYAGIINGADLVTPDGMPVTKALAMLHGIRQERVAGMDLLPDLLAAASQMGLSVFLYGSTQDVIDGMLRRIGRELPELRISGVYCPPFRPATPEETSEDVCRINASGAHLVLVALGCPKQERWMAANRGCVNAIMVGIGGAFPVYAGLQSRAPRLMQRLSLEWFYRLCQEPRRLFRRYLITNSIFSCLLAKKLVSKTIHASRGIVGGD